MASLPLFLGGLRTAYGSSTVYIADDQLFIVNLRLRVNRGERTLVTRWPPRTHLRFSALPSRLSFWSVVEGWELEMRHLPTSF